MTANKILVTGASGLLGRAVMRKLSGVPEIELIGTAYSRTVAPLVKVNIGYY